MDGRWLLLTLLVAAVAAIRLRRHASQGPSTDAESGDVTGREALRPGSEPADRPFPRRPIADAERPVDRSPQDAFRSFDSPGDDTLQAALERVWAEHAHGADTLLDARLRLLVHRGVPVRALRRAPQGKAVRVVFADGTVVLCRGAAQGDFGRLGLALHKRSVRLGAYSHDSGRTHLEFRWSPGQRLAALAVGLDQPD